ncbi:hypothetical protein [Nocardia sp. XZ_19_385]|uniref:hypothetical protein n=1 Tax=Nocardia sp. XZ_19_385 TaxID=2769488 RepID=UPI00188EA442|nr:hypothetical protein [Nocardia sp. XZ_19_385]
MATIQNFRPALAMSIFGAIGAAVVATAAPALAANSIDATALGPANIAADYSCDPAAGVTAIKAMVGAPDADRPSAIGTQGGLTCDGNRHNTVVILDGASLSPGQTVQVRIALVDNADNVITGQAKVANL